MPNDTTNSLNNTIGNEQQQKKKRHHKKRRHRSRKSRVKLANSSLNSDGVQITDGKSGGGLSNRTTFDLSKLTPSNITSLRWEYTLSDPKLEEQRIEKYKENRRQRYIEHRNQSLMTLMENVSLT